MTSVLITGSKGQLGSEIERISPEFEDMSFLFTDLEELDITQPGDVGRFLDENPVRFLVNCAGYTAVDQAEDEEDNAHLINAQATETLARISAERGMQMIHLSTDYVFDGRKNHPYTETDPVNPQTVYGRSKLQGEVAVKSSGSGIIIRTSWLYSVFGRNFVKTILRLSAEKEELKVVFDQTGSPTYANDLARVILEMIRAERDRDNSPRFDIYHYSNLGMCNWYEFASTIVELARTRCRILPVESSAYVTKARRPRYSVLSNAKIMAEFNINPPHWKESLAVCMNELSNK